MCQLFIGPDSQYWASQTRSLRINEMVTSIRLETYLWTVLQQIADRDDINLPQIITRLYHESIDAGHDMGNFTPFLRVCCIRYLNLQLSGDIPKQASVSISSLDVEQILQEEAGTSQRFPH